MEILPPDDKRVRPGLLFIAAVWVYVVHGRVPIRREHRVHWLVDEDLVGIIRRHEMHASWQIDHICSERRRVGARGCNVWIRGSQDGVKAVARTFEGTEEVVAIVESAKGVGVVL